MTTIDVLPREPAMLGDLINFFLKNSFVVAFPNRPTDGRNTPWMIFFAEGEPFLTPQPTLIKIHRNVIFTETSSHYHPNNIGNRTLKE
jgi:hypothetical protein